jgi:hypothetical protein
LAGQGGGGGGRGGEEEEGGGGGEEEEGGGGGEEEEGGESNNSTAFVEMVVLSSSLVVASACACALVAVVAMPGVKANSSSFSLLAASSRVNRIGTIDSTLTDLLLLLLLLLSHVAEEEEEEGEKQEENDMESNPHLDILSLFCCHIISSLSLPTPSCWSLAQIGCGILLLPVRLLPKKRVGLLCVSVYVVYMSDTKKTARSTVQFVFVCLFDCWWF